MMDKSSKKLSRKRAPKAGSVAQSLPEAKAALDEEELKKVSGGTENVSLNYTKIEYKY